MKVLILGSGAKDHAVCWWFSKSRLIDGLFVAPGNPGTSLIAENLKDVDITSGESVLDACRKHGIDFVFVGTEAPLLTGVIDFLNASGINTFGAPNAALKLENDRNYARGFTEKYNIPTPSHSVFTKKKDLEEFLNNNNGRRFVVKSNKMAPSREMVDSSDKKTILKFAAELLKSGPVLLEDHIQGIPVTVTLFVDNNGYFLLPIAGDYTSAGTGDNNAPTGGMGSICPIPLTAKQKDFIFNCIINPTIEGMKQEGIAYKGVLTFSLILSDDHPYLVDYHVRFNDPATQAMVPLIRNDIVELLAAMESNTLSSVVPSVIAGSSTVAVVIASKGYPSSPVIGCKIEPINPMLILNSFENNPRIFLGAVENTPDGTVTSGGRCVTVVGIGGNILEANHNAYGSVKEISFKGAWYREDIGNHFFTC